MITPHNSIEETGGSLRRKIEGYKRILELDQETLDGLAGLSLHQQLRTLKVIYALDSMASPQEQPPRKN